MKGIRIILILIIILATIIFSESTYALDISLGASSWYCWWDMKMESNDPNSGGGAPELDAALLYGPVFSVKFSPSWSIASIFLYGKYKAEGEGPNEMVRMDSDTTLNYTINRYLKIFAGFKYMSYAWDESDGDGTHNSMGGGLGMGTILPLSGNFFVLINAAGIYLKGTHEENNTGGSAKLDFDQYGVNTTISLAYYIDSASTTLSLGGRYQYVKDDSEDGSFDLEHKFYGVTFSAVYSFDI